MKIHTVLLTLAMGVAVLSGCSKAPPAGNPGGLTPVEARSIAQDGYVFGLPLVYVATQADVVTNVAKPEPGRAPLNQFDHHRSFPDAKHNKIVGMNVDTLYSLAQLDLSAEPMVLVVPPMTGKRWWIMQVLDGWNDVPAAPGSRTHGGKGGAFVLVGPDYEGDLPAGLEVIRSDTSIVALGGRTYTAGPDDYAAVHAIQDQYQLIPLSQWKGAGTHYTPPQSVPVKPGIDGSTPVPAQVFALTPQQYFQRLSDLLVHNPAREADAPIMARLAKFGVTPGGTFDLQAFDAETRQAIEEGVAAGQQQVRDGESDMGKMVNGWQVATDLGRYGTRYPYRATWTYYGVGGNLVEDALYPLGLVDADGNRLDGAGQYELRFAKDEIPPVDAFWSVTLYDEDSYLVDNPLNRYALGDRSRMQRDPDGLLTLYIQGESPGKDKESNWLPSPKEGPFKLALRLYVPKKEVADGTWQPPAVKRIG